MSSLSPGPVRDIAIVNALFTMHDLEMALGPRPYSTDDNAALSLLPRLPMEYRRVTMECVVEAGKRLWRVDAGWGFVTGKSFADVLTAALLDAHEHKTNTPEY